MRGVSDVWADSIGPSGGGLIRQERAGNSDQQGTRGRGVYVWTYLSDAAGLERGLLIGQDVQEHCVLSASKEAPARVHEEMCGTSEKKKDQSNRV